MGDTSRYVTTLSSVSADFSYPGPSVMVITVNDPPFRSPCLDSNLGKAHDFRLSDVRGFESRHTLAVCG